MQRDLEGLYNHFKALREMSKFAHTRDVLKAHHKEDAFNTYSFLSMNQ